MIYRLLNDCLINLKRIYMSKTRYLYQIILFYKKDEKT